MHLQVVRESASDKILLIGAGVTLFECLKAADTLAGEGVHACVIDPFTIKPLDKELIIKHAKRVGGRVLTVEDHYPAGGINHDIRFGLCLLLSSLLCCHVAKGFRSSGA